MRSRQEIKFLAKEAMKEQRGTAILIYLLVALIGGVGSFLGYIPFIGPLASIALSFLTMALGVNVCAAFIKIYYKEKTDVGFVFNSLSVNFFRKVGGMYWMGLWTFLWSLLLIVPGIIKSLAYSQTSYILADCPDVGATDALKLSMRMTDGHKMELFVLGLSWIGWCMLSALTFGIVGIVYVFRYVGTTAAGYYVELRDLAIDSGRILPEELGFVINEEAAPEPTV
jgi:uncharacterized membrane protein